MKIETNEILTRLAHVIGELHIRLSALEAENERLKQKIAEQSTEKGGD